MDAARGLAVLLMVLDHLLVVVDVTNPLRYSLTRLSLPLFGLAAGYVLTATSSTRRRVVVLALGVAITPASIEVGLGQPDVLLVFAVALIVAHATLGRVPPSLVAAAGILSAVAWPLPISGYHPGYVLAFIACGLVLQAEVEQGRTRLPDLQPSTWVAVLTAVGRRPLTYYVVHVLALWAVVVVARG